MRLGAGATVRAVVTKTPDCDPIDELGMLLSCPEASSVARILQLLKGATNSDCAQIFTMLHVTMGTPFVQEVLSAMDPALQEQMRSMGSMSIPNQGYVMATFRAAMALLGHTGLTEQVMKEATDNARRDSEGRILLPGIAIQRAMHTVLGWDNVYFDMRGCLVGLDRMGTTCFGAHVKVMSPGELELKSSILEEIPLAIITVNSGNHMRLLARGVFYACYWNGGGPHVFHAWPLDTPGLSVAALLTAPREYVARLRTTSDVLP